VNIQLTLALRYLNGHKLRSFLTTLAVVFGVVVLFGMNAILPSMLKALQANEMAAGGVVDATITHVTSGSFDTSVFDTVKAIDGVSAAAPSLGRTVNLPADFFDKDPAKPDLVTALSLVGIDPAEERTLRAFPITSGRFLETGDGASAVISQTLADLLGIQVGGAFAIPSTQGIVDLTVVGILPPRAIPGNEEVLVTLPEAQSLADQPGQINTVSLNLNSNDEARRSQILAAVEAAIGKDYTIGSLSTGSDLVASLRLGQQLFSIFGVLALFMGAFIIFNTFRTIVVERRRDIGMLRAIGADRRTITGLILIEGLLQGALGTAIGLAVGYLLAAGTLKLATPLMSQYINLKLGGPVILPEFVALSIVMGVGVTVLAGLLPALNASKVTPLEALHPTVAEVEFKRQTGRGFIAGAVLVALSLLALFSGQTGLIGLGAILFLAGLVLVAPALVRPIAFSFGWLISRLAPRSSSGELAKNNLARQPSRVAITASATMLGLAVVVAMGGTVTSLSYTLGDVLKKSLGSDYLLIPPSIALWNTDMGANPSFASQLRSVDGVAVVSTLRFAAAQAGGQSVSLLGIDPAAFRQISGLVFQQNLYASENAAYQALTEGRNLIANGAMAGLLKVKAGDTIELVTPGGSQTYRIVAVASDLLNAKVTTAYTSQANLAADFNKTEDVFIQLNLKPGADASAADRAIRAASAQYPQFNIVAGRAYLSSMLSELNVAFSALYFLLAMLALPSLIAMLNTLAIGVIERTREFGMLRAVGSTQQQVRRMVITEALILAGIGTAFGVAAGLYLGYVLVLAFAAVFPLGYAFPAAGIFAAIVIGLGFGALAAIIPARQAARLQIVQALRYE
jgi:putative ABC transport system permease protein